MIIFGSDWKIRLKFTKWRRGTVWNIFLIPSIEIHPWQRCVSCPKPGDYYTIYLISQFLKSEIAIGVSRERFK